jgi:hypothetical protein
MSCIHPFRNWWRLGRLVNREHYATPAGVTLTSPNCFARGSYRYEQRQLHPPIVNVQMPVPSAQGTHVCQTLVPAIVMTNR